MSLKNKGNSNKNNSVASKSSPPPLPPIPLPKTLAQKEKPNNKSIDEKWQAVFDALYFADGKIEMGLGGFLFLYVSIVIDFGGFVTIMVFDFLGLVPTLDYYFSIFPHLLHLFTWAFVFCCLSRMFSSSFYRITLLLYGVSFFFDIAAMIWRIVATHTCSAALCGENFLFGVVGYCISILFVIWDVVVFVTIVLLLFMMAKYAKAMQQKVSDLQKTMSEELNDERKRNMQQGTATLSGPLPLASTNFNKNSIFSAAAIIEPIFFFVIAALCCFGFVVTPFFLWTIFFNCLHTFSWVFLICATFNNYSKIFQISVFGLYVVNLFADIAAFAIRAVILINCDPSTNVDCIFRRFPGWLPIQTLSGFLVVIDLVVIITLPQLYKWMFHNVWKEIAKGTLDLKKLKRKKVDNNNLSDGAVVDIDTAKAAGPASGKNTTTTTTTTTNTSSHDDNMMQKRKAITTFLKSNDFK